MKFTVISHACLYVEYEDIKLLIDPWIIGSCYWRSWWNYPEVSQKLVQKIKPTHIYITHLHWDHYHGPSLRNFKDLNPTFLFPKHFNKRMKKDLLRDFKFSKIKELNHGQTYNLRDDFQISSYQFNPFIIDSSIVIEVNGIKILNCNDSKTFGLSLKQIINNHPDIDFAFRSHSSASPIPHCIKDINLNKTDRTPSDYADDFIAFAQATRSKYVIPFASSHIFLHPISKKFNKFYSDPSYIKNQFESKANTAQKCQIMVSGSSWSKHKGFNLKAHNFSNLKSDIEKYSIKYQKKINKQTEIGNKQKLNKRAFEKYYLNFMRACSFPFNLLNFRFGFVINDEKNTLKYLCIIDGKVSSTKVIETSRDDEIYKNKLDFIIKTPIYVFNDCNVKKMHNTFTPSKLLEIIILERNGQRNINKYFSLVDLYENDSLPFYRLISVRNIIIIFRRWRELIDMFFYFYYIKIKKKKIHNLWHSL
tara:strand:- start:6107 stop:7534 length:1428 start_codon:yes stop_codon:yes gene_type:complete